MTQIATVKKVLVLAAIIILPCVFYLTIRTGQNHYTPPDYYGPRTLGVGDGKKDTVYHTVPAFEFVNFDGSTISSNNFEQKIYVADFFFATCPTICPKMAGQMQRLQIEFKDDPEVLLLSHTVNPEKDTVAALAAYALAHNAQPGKWYIVTGEKELIYNQAREGYFVSATEGSGGPDDFIHSELFVLVDKENHIRGYFDGTDINDVAKLIDQIKVLQYNYKHSK